MSSHSVTPILQDYFVSAEDVLKQVRLANNSFAITEAIEDILSDRLAKQLDLSVREVDVEAAIESFRVRLGLTKPEDLKNWLSERRIEFADFVRKFEQMVRKAELAHLVCGPLVDEHFSENRDLYDVFTVEQLVLRGVSESHEAMRRLIQDGIRFDEVAEDRSLLEGNQNQGLVGLFYREDLPQSLYEAAVNIELNSPRVLGPFSSEASTVVCQIVLIKAALLDAPLRERIESKLFDKWMNDQVQKAERTTSSPEASRGREPGSLEDRLSRREVMAAVVATAIGANILSREQTRFALDRSADQWRLPLDSSDGPIAWGGSGARRGDVTLAASDVPPSVPKPAPSPTPPPPPPPAPPRPAPVAGTRG